MNRLSMIRGDDRTYTIVLTDGDTGEALDLTGLDVTFTAESSGLADIVKTIDDGITVTEPDEGTFELALLPSDTDALTRATRYRWDVQVEDGAVVRTPLRGTLDVYLDVTRSVAIS